MLNVLFIIHVDNDVYIDIFVCDYNVWFHFYVTLVNSRVILTVYSDCELILQYHVPNLFP